MMWLGVAAIILVIGLILYWQLIIVEGAYLGAPLVAFLYDWTAERYNKIKEFDKIGELITLGHPLANRLYAQPKAVALDVATGTGRIPLQLLDQQSYRGHIIGLDRAAKMLAVTQRDTAGFRHRVSLVQADAMALPFASNSLPMVTCLEALEFLPNPKKGLAEMIRVLQPSSATHPTVGWLLTTNRIGWETWLMPGKAWSREKLENILSQMPLQYIDIQIWESIYDLVWAQKIEADQPKIPPTVAKAP